MNFDAHLLMSLAAILVIVVAMIGMFSDAGPKAMAPWEIGDDVPELEAHNCTREAFHDGPCNGLPLASCNPIYRRDIRITD